MGPDFLRLGNEIILVAHPGTHGDLMGRSRRQIEISDRQREILERLERALSTEQQLARRVRMVLGCAEGRTNLELSNFNAVLAKPFKWTYTGRPLKVGE
jgi:hypothetical protein